MGLARLESSVPNDNGRYPITFLTLSRFKRPSPEFEQSQGTPFAAMNVNKAKAVLEAIKKSLANGSNRPTFPEYYVSVLIISFLFFFFFTIFKK